MPKPSRQFSANVGDASTGAAGPDRIEQDFDDLFAMLNAGSTLSVDNGSGTGGIRGENLRFFLDTAADLPASDVSRGDVAIVKDPVGDGTYLTTIYCYTGSAWRAIASSVINYGGALRPSFLVNGGFEIWQRGAGAFTSGYTADRWLISSGSGSTVSVSRDAANQDVGSRYCAAVTYTHSAASNLQQKIEDYYQARGQTVSMSMKVKTSTASAARLFLYDGITTTYGSYHTGGGAFEKLTVTAAIASAGTQLLIGIEFNASATIYLDNAALCIGDVGTDYSPLTPAEELAICHRYYQVLGGVTGGYPQVGGAYASGAKNYQLSHPWHEKMVTTPTVTIEGTWAVSNCGQPSSANPSVSGFKLQVAASGAGDFYAHPDSSDDLVKAEANP